jgi:hypothetical protein
MAGGTRDRCRGECSGHGTDDTADHHRRQVRSPAVANREITKRGGAGRMATAGRHVAGGGADRIAALALAGAGPLSGGADRVAANPHTPLYGARAGTLMPVARNRIKFIEIAIHLRQNRPAIPGPGNGPFLFERRVPGRKFVIASPALAKSGVASHRRRDQATAGREMCWLPLQARAAEAASVTPVRTRSERRRLEAD